MAEDERTLPLFPLNTVLFPGLPLPLHIFEERYRLMIGACMVTDRMFGVCLIREGQEVGEPAVPYEVGTVARIVDVERLEDGKMNLVSVGMQRFRVLRLLEERPFMVGRIRALRSSAEDVPPGLTTEVGERFLAYVRDLRGPEVGDRVKLPDEPEKLSYQLAAILGIVASERQALLELDSTVERLRRLREIIHHDHEMLRVGQLKRATSGGTPFSRN